MQSESPVDTQEFVLATFERSPTGMLAVDAEGKIVAVNREVERLLGYNRSELIGQSVEILVPDQHARAHPNLRQAYLSRPEARPMGAGRDLYARHRDGRDVPVEIGLSPVDVKGKSYILSTIVDITERRQLEQHLRQAQKLEAIGNLASGIAHDFNNILHGILGYAELAKESLVDQPNVSADLDVIIDSAARGRDLVSRILVFARKGEPKRKKTRLEPTLHEAAQLLRATFPHRIEIRFHIDPTTPDITADSTELHQIVMNLANNAAQAMGDRGGVIDIQAGPMLVNEKWPKFFRRFPRNVFVHQCD